MTVSLLSGMYKLNLLEGSSEVRGELSKEFSVRVEICFEFCAFLLI